MPKYIFTSVILLAIMVASCNSSSSNADFCEYNSEKFSMKIINVSSLPDDSTQFEITVDFDGNTPFSETTHNLEDVRDVHTDLEFVIRNNVRVGQIYKGTMYTLQNNASDCEKRIIDWDNKLK